MSDLNEKLAEAKKEAEKLKEKLQKKRDEGNDAKLKEVAASLPAIPENKRLRVRRKLKGHLSKVNAVQWGPGDQQLLLSASQDGRLIVWSAQTTNKLYGIPLRSPWVMTCAFSPAGNTVVSGGLDNLVSVYVLSRPDAPFAELNKHEGYISCTRFVDQGHLLTSSGDSTCMLWDLETRNVNATFQEHSADAMIISISPTDPNVFVSGSVDKSTKVWDSRNPKKSVQSFEGHTADINAASWFPNGNAFATGSDDCSCLLWDIRADRQLAEYKSEELSSGVTSIDFSKSGRFLFAGSDDATCHVYDSMRGERVWGLTGHEGRVTCVAVSPDGMGMSTGSWDSNISVWA